MKATRISLALTISLLTGATVQAQQTDAGAESDFFVSERGPHHRVVQSVSLATNDLGVVSTRTNTYTELTTAMHYFERGHWNETEEIIEILPDGKGAVASKGPHKVIFPPDIYDGQVELNLPDGASWLRLRVLGLSYYDTASGRSVLIAETTNSVGELHGGNVVIYPEAFTDLRADVRLTYTKAGFEQDIILREQPPSCEEWDMDPATTKLQVLTEFYDQPPPGKRELTVTDSRGASLTDEILDFPGAMQMGTGRAFSLDPSVTGENIPVTKRWLKMEGGRDVLVEEVEVRAVEKGLESLPKARSASLPGGTNVIRQARLGRPALPTRRQAQATSKPMRMAKISSSARGFVLDFTTLNTGQTNYAFKGDSTTYLSGNVVLAGTNTTFEAGTVLKYASNVTLTVNTPVTWLGSSYRPVVLTSKDDNSVGETISGSTGNPGTNYYAANALYFNAAVANTNLVLQNLRVANATRAVAINTKAGHVLKNVQFVMCANGLALTNAEVRLRNALMDRVRTNFTGSSSTGRVEHLTVNQSTRINASIGSNLFITNSLLVLVTNYTTFTSFKNVSNFLASGVFTNVGAGYHYLVASSTNRNVGTTNINAALLADLKKLTTYPPIVYSNIVLSVSTNWTPQAHRDTSTNDLPDVGFHYDPLDYWSVGYTLSNSASLTLSNGVAVGLSGTAGFKLVSATNYFYSAGKPDAMNRIVWYPAVQEQPVKLNNHAPSTAEIFSLVGSGPNALQTVGLSFTDFPMQGLRQYLVNTTPWYGPAFALTNCWLRGVNLQTYDVPWAITYNQIPYVILHNNLIERSTITLVNGYTSVGSPPYYNNPLGFTLYNNLIWQSTLTLTYNDALASYHPAWTLKDNLFDTATVTLTGDGSYSSYISRGTNAFFNTSATSLGGAGNLTVTALAYATGPLGRWYIDSASPTLADVGSRTAIAAGMYHYTITSNQVKETTSQLDIGFHYVVVDSFSGKPADTDSDGVPDYLEDANGDGNGGNDPSSWQTYNSPNGLSTGSGLRVFTPLK